MKKIKIRGFTIVELLVVITIIAILAALIIVTYSNMQQRSARAKQETDVAHLVRAIMVAREKEGKALRYITGDTWTMGGCEIGGNNPGGTEPRDLVKTHPCWTKYYQAIDRIAAAAETNLNELKKGDTRGNPYAIDENEAETSQPCNSDGIYSYIGSGVTRSAITRIPLAIGVGC